MLAVAGAMFGWSIALYSIIYQFCSTQVIQWLYKRYKKETLLLSQTSLMKYTRLLKKLLITMLLYSRELAVMKAGKDTSLLCNSFRGNKTAYTAYTKC